MKVDQRLVGRVWDLLKARDAALRPRATHRPRLSIVDNADGPSDLMLYDNIGYWGVSAQDVADQLQGRRGDLHVRINSGGGDVFDGYAIYNMLVTHDGLITVTVEGLAASAASFIAQAGDTINVCLASQMMIHDASGVCIGNAADMREWADVLDCVSDTIASVYAERAGGDPAVWRTVMLGEKWYTPQQAVDAGLADQVIGPDRQAALPPAEPVEPDEPDEPEEPGEPPEPDEPKPGKPSPGGQLPSTLIAARAHDTIVDTAVGPHDTAAKEGTWDKGANEGRLPSPVPLGTARKFYAAYDETKVEDGAIPKGAGMLPHHFVDADGTPGAASINGVHNALARLSQTKGLSDAERATVERHLRGHLPADDNAEGHHDQAHDHGQESVDAGDNDEWAAAAAGLLTPSLSTADGLLSDLREKGWA